MLPELFTEPLSGLKRADVVIVGAGMTGLMLAVRLLHGGARVALVEQEQPGRGASALCTGTASTLHMDMYARAEMARSTETARTYLETLEHSLVRMKAVLPTDCRPQETSVYAYAMLDEDLPALDAQMALAHRLKLPLQAAPDAGGCPFPVEASARLEDQLMLDPQALVERLVRTIASLGGVIYPSSPVIAIEGRRACTTVGCAEAPVIVMTAGYPPGMRKLRHLALLSAHTMIGCHLTGTLPLHTCQRSVRPGGLGMRPVPGGMLTSWDAGCSGTSVVTRRTELLERVLTGRLPEWEIVSMDFRQELYPVDGLPLIGVLPEYGGHVLCAAGYAGSGLLGAHHASGVLARRLLGRALPQDAIFRPDRTLRTQVLQSGLRRLARAYTANFLHLLAPVCPHRGCRLRYHPQSQQWQCPICGSVFNLFGRRITGACLRSTQISPSRRPLQ